MSKSAHLFFFNFQIQWSGDLKSDHLKPGLFESLISNGPICVMSFKLTLVKESFSLWYEEVFYLIERLNADKKQEVGVSCLIYYGVNSITLYKLRY